VRVITFNMKDIYCGKLLRWFAHVTEETLVKGVDCMIF